MLKRRGRDDQHFPGIEQPVHYFRSSQRLDGFAEAHVVADQAAACPDREQRAFFLVRVEHGFQKLPKHRAFHSLAQPRGENPAPMFIVLVLRHKGHDVVVAAHFMAGKAPGRINEFQNIENMFGLQRSVPFKIFKCKGT